MAEPNTKTFTYVDVSEHTTKKDIYVVIHDQVYDASSFIDEHPGGEEVLLDVGGQDATEAFEDVGHSDEAREKLNELKIGDLKRQEGDPVPRTSLPSSTTSQLGKSTSSSAGMGIGVYALILIGGALAFVAYQYLQGQQSTKS